MVLLIIPFIMNAQIGDWYSFSESSGTYTEITGGTISTATGDDGEELNVPIGFNFDYVGTTYTTLTIGTNGAVSFTNTNIGYTNDLASTTATNLNYIAPLWDDLYAYTTQAVEIRYETAGTTPNQTFTVQFKNISWRLAANTVNFQIVLFEGSNNIVFNYGVNNNISEVRTASIGFNVAPGGSNNFISVTPGSPATTSTTVSNNLISYTEYPGDGHSYTFTYTPPSCLPPTSPTVVSAGATTASLSWVAGGTETLWDVEYGAAPFTPTGTPSVGYDDLASPAAALSGLTSETDYVWYVRADCGGDNVNVSAWVGPITFTTACASVVAPAWSEGFENAGTIPDCWTQGSANGENWIFSLTGGHVGNAGAIGGSTVTGSYFAYVDDSSPNNLGTTLQSPFIDVSALTLPAVEFYLISNNEGNSNVDFSVDVWDGAAWNTVFLRNSNTASGEWEKKSIALTRSYYYW